MTHLTYVDDEAKKFRQDRVGQSTTGQRNRSPLDGLEIEPGGAAFIGRAAEPFWARACRRIGRKFPVSLIRTPGLSDTCLQAWQLLDSQAVNTLPRSHAIERNGHWRRHYRGGARARSLLVRNKWGDIFGAPPVCF